MDKPKRTFDEVLALVNHIGEEERHFNALEMEYRKLASQWLLVSLGAIGYVLSRENQLVIPPWTLVIGISLAAAVGIFIIWILDLRVYHQLLHAAFMEGVKLEQEYPEFLPQIRTQMRATQQSGDIVRRVVLFYFFSILALLVIANIAAWNVCDLPALNVAVHVVTLIAAAAVYRHMLSISRKNDQPVQKAS